MKNNKSLFFIFFVFLSFTESTIGQGQFIFKQSSVMGSTFEVTYITRAPGLMEINVFGTALTEARRIEKVISSWSPYSETAEINKNAGIQPVKVSEELFQLIFRSIKISELTDGAFDITFAAADKIWTFDGQEVEKMPDPATVAASIAKIDYKNIILDKKNNTVFLKEKGMKIGFGGIGKGYAADKIKADLQALGLEDGLISVGGDLVAWGAKLTNDPWQVGIVDPTAPKKTEKKSSYQSSFFKKKQEKKRIIGWLEASGKAIVTSGDYENYFMHNGVRYGHIINPKTGYPTTGIKSVSVVTSSVEFGDALATAIFVLGVEKGLKLVNQLKGVDCLIIDDDNELHTSRKLSIEYYE